MTDELGLIVAAHHPLAGRRSLGVEELGELDWILREEGSGTRRVFERALEQAAIPVRHLPVMMQLSSLRAIVAMVANNVGVSVVSRAVFDSDEITVSNIVPIAIERLNLRRTLEAVLPTEPSSSMVEHLLEDLRRDVEIRQKRTRLT
jgi:DNA-binding transcriptional LysR family regulator